MSTVASKDKALKPPVNYEMLSHYKYMKMYQFTPIEVRDTPEEVMLSDKLEKLLYAGFMHKDTDFDDLLGGEVKYRGKSVQKDRKKQSEIAKVNKDDENKLLTG